MPLVRSECKIIKKDLDTPGGSTFTVKVPNPYGDGIVRAFCFRHIPNHSELRCANVAGFKTSHVGTGACYKHGGNNDKNPHITTGQDATVTRRKLESQIQRYLSQDRSELLDMSRELASSKAIFQEFMERFPIPNDDTYGINLHRFAMLVGTIGTLVDKITKIENRNTLTSAQILYLRATMVDLFMKYIADPGVRERASKELASRLGGDVEWNSEPFEIDRAQVIDA